MTASDLNAARQIISCQAGAIKSPATEIQQFAVIYRLRHVGGIGVVVKFVSIVLQAFELNRVGLIEDLVGLTYKAATPYARRK